MKDIDSILKDKSLETQAVRGGQARSMEREHSEAMYLTSSYVFETAADAAATFSGEREGNVYSRYTNPTVATFEKRLALMEGGEAAVGTASGMSAILALCMSLLKSGDHIVASKSLFGSTIGLFNNYLKKFGVETTLVSLTDTNAWRDAILPETKLFFLESPSNPLTEVGDISAISEIAKSHNILTAVDNCFCTPALQRPLSLGADFAVHSATKYIDGQGRAMGGAVVGRKQHIDELVGFLRTAGPTMSPFNAWIFLKGLETLNIRMKAHCESALEIAQWLETLPQVKQVYYAGLPSHGNHELAKQQMSAFGGVLSFELNNREEAWTVIDATQLLSVTANLGDTKTTITHPATTSHGRLSEEQRLEAGITQGLIRLAVGLEGVEDIKQDLLLGLEKL